MAKVTQEDIIQAAITLFIRNGYHATSMRDIARTVDIQKPSLYHHFESKEAILLAILNAAMDQLIETVEEITYSQDDCITKLKKAVRAHAELIANNPGGAAVVLHEDRGLGDVYMAQYLSKRDHFEGLFRTILQQGVSENVLKDTDVTISANALLGMVNWMTRWYRPEGRLSAMQIADMFAVLFLDGLRLQQ